MTKIVRKFSVCSLNFQWWFKLLQEVLVKFKNLTSIWEVPINKTESFLKLHFWTKLNMHNSAYTKLLNLELQSNWLALHLKLIQMVWSYKKCLRIAVGRGLGWVRIKNFLPQTVPDKIFATNWSSPVKLDKNKKVWYLLFRVF